VVAARPGRSERPASAGTISCAQAVGEGNLDRRLGGPRWAPPRPPVPRSGPRAAWPASPPPAPPRGRGGPAPGGWRPPTRRRRCRRSAGAWLIAAGAAGGHHAVHQQDRDGGQDAKARHGVSASVLEPADMQPAGLLRTPPVWAHPSCPSGAVGPFPSGTR
jgi:hypothetical protein